MIKARVQALGEATTSKVCTEEEKRKIKERVLELHKETLNINQKSRFESVIVKSGEINVSEGTKKEEEEKKRTFSFEDITEPVAEKIVVRDVDIVEKMKDEVDLEAFDDPNDFE
jgi:hypothetical protein